MGFHTKFMMTSAGVVAAVRDTDRRRLGSLSVIWLLILLLPYWIPYAGGYVALGSRVLIYALAAMGLNLLLGFTGGLSFGHAAYFGLGAYGAGLALKFMTTSTPLAIVAGTVLGGVAAVVFGVLCVRRRGIYFAMITIAIGQMFYFIAFRWNTVTGGDDGLSGFARTPLDLFGYHIQLESIAFYYLVVVCFAIGVGILGVVLRSPLGHTFVAIRDNSQRLKFLGVPISTYVWISFGISGFIVALAGSLDALLDNFTSPNTLHWALSGDFVIMAVLGGMRTFWGPLVGAVIFVVAQDYISSATDNWMTFIGLLFIVVVLLFPLGILGFLQKRAAR